MLVLEGSSGAGKTTRLGHLLESPNYFTNTIPRMIHRRAPSDRTPSHWHTTGPATYEAKGHSWLAE